jgi:hypothetical protein
MSIATNVRLFVALFAVKPVLPAKKPVPVTFIVFQQPVEE